MPGLTYSSAGRLVVGLVVAALLATSGCSRQNFRTRADKDVEGVLSQKNLFPDWQIENWHAYPDPRARHADPSNPDFPPYPPDDYAAWLLSPNPQKPGRGGAGRYEGDGYLQQIESWDTENRTNDPAPATPAPGSASGTMPIPDPAAPAVSTEHAFRIKLDQTVELGLFNSREFQDRREDLYLAALPVTLERFGFAAQALAAESVIRQSTGRDYPGANGGGEAWQIGTNPQISRKLATGGELLVKLANQIVVDLSGPKPQTSLSNLTFTFAQPFLKGGGYAVTLEALTQAERTLLYAIRSYARFRRVFYTSIVGTGDYTNNPYGLQGLAANLGRGVGANLTAQRVGYLPTVLRGATLANERRNVSALESTLKLFQNLKEGGGVSDLQVVQVELNLIGGRTTVLNSTRLYRDSVDNFKLQLGVPATLPLELDDTPLHPVQDQLKEFDAVYDQLTALEKAASQYDPTEPPANYRARWVKLFTESTLVKATTFAKDFPKLAEQLRSLPVATLEQYQKQLLERRRKLLDAQADRQLKNQAEPAGFAADLDGVDAALDRARFEAALRRYEAQPWLGSPADRRPADQALAFRAAFDAGMLVAIVPRNQRLAKLRSGWPDLPPVVIDDVDLLRVPLEEANAKIAQTALINRLDLMNARAQLVDSWRQIGVRANALKGTFDVKYTLDTASPRDEANGLGFSGTRSRHTVTMNIEPPLVRRAERNQYRTALISYQRSRRNLMAFEDNILTDTRTDLRQLRQLAETYQLQQRIVELAYAQLDNARSTFVAPPDPAARDSAGSVVALTQQLLSAQAALVKAQNDQLTNWVNYLTFRMELFLDLEMLPLDARGLWPDERPASQPVAPPSDPAAERLPTPRPG